MKTTFPAQGNPNCVQDLIGTLGDAGCKFSVRLRSGRPGDPKPKSNAKGKGKVKGKGKYGRRGGGYRLNVIGPAGGSHIRNKLQAQHMQNLRS
jgi:hypothetical protein